jgi:hypothetical protein
VTDPTDPITPHPGVRLPDEPQAYDDWLLSEHVVPPPSAGSLEPSYLQPETGAAPARGWRSITRTHKIVAVLAAGIIAAGGVAVAAAAGSGASDDATTTNAAGPVPGGAQGFVGAGDGRGGVDGEQRVQGTVTGTTGSSVTVKATDGASATYTVTSDTQVVRDGTQASLSDVQVGDQVLVHVLPTTSGGHPLAERVFAGTLPAGGFGPGGNDDNGVSGSDSTGTGDTSTT